MKSNINVSVSSKLLFMILKNTLNYDVAISMKFIVFILIVLSTSIYYLINPFISMLLFSQSNYRYLKPLDNSYLNSYFFSS